MVNFTDAAGREWPIAALADSLDRDLVELLETAPEEFIDWLALDIARLAAVLASGCGLDESELRIELMLNRDAQARGMLAVLMALQDEFPDFERFNWLMAFAGMAMQAAVSHLLDPFEV